MAEKNKQFRWSDEMNRALINSLVVYKARMEFSGLDFDADRNSQYKALRTSMADVFSDNTDLFGPIK